MEDMKQKAEELREKRMQVVYRHMAAGVSFIDPFHVYIDESVVIGKGTSVYPGVILEGGTVIGSGCLIGQNSRIKDSQIGNEVQIQASVVLESRVGDLTTIGPFAYLRPGTELGRKVKIGDFVEVKKSKIGDGSKASHLAYIGDAEVGRDVNISCGVIFCNYDGMNKYQTTVKDGAFIGSNSNLVAPVVVEKDGYVAAGSTVVKDVPEGALCVVRPAARVIPGWVSRKFPKQDKK